MEESHPLEKAIAKVGLARLARTLEVTGPAIRKWQRAGRLPRTEWTGETDYAERISAACGGEPSAVQLKAPWPKWEPPAVQASAQDVAIQQIR